jgi:hypothetical protein
MAVSVRPAKSRWFVKSLGDPLLAGEPLSLLERLFRAERAKAGDPPEMAIFVRPESEGRLHCEVRAYFSPASAAVARAVDADPCDRPFPEGLSLLAGTPDAWQALFPDRPA